jgi:hypothetical protein
MEASKTGNAEDWEPVTDEPGMPLKLLTWRQKLSGKAKQEKKFRFYSLYSLVIRDRVVQMAVKLIIEPIFEADFNDCSYGYRPGRSAQDAIKAIQGHLKDGKASSPDSSDTRMTLSSWPPSSRSRSKRLSKGSWKDGWTCG